MSAYLAEYLPTLKRQLAYGKFFKCIPHEWDKKERKVIHIKTRLRQISLWTLLHGFYVTFQVVNLITDSSSLVDKLVALLIAGVNGVCYGYKLEFEVDNTAMGNHNRLISGIDTPPSLKKPVLLALKWMCMLMEGSYWIWGMGMAAMTAFSSCKPPTLGSFILCRVTIPSLYSRWLITLLLAGFEFLMAMQITISGCHYVIHSQLPGTIIFWGRSQEFIHTQGSEVDVIVKGYRQLHIMEKIHNSICRGIILPVTLIAIPLMEILGGFGLVMLYDTANMSQLSLFLACYLDSTAFCMILLTSASFIYIKSKGWINDVKSQIDGRKGYFKRVQKSYRPLRLEFGNNFVDRLTPLVMQDFCNCQMASLVLLAKS